MSYRFVKVYDKKLDLKYNWMLSCTNLDTLQEHNEKCVGGVISDGVNDHFTNDGHSKTFWRSAISRLETARGCGMNFLETSLQLENDILSGKIKHLKRCGELLLRENGTYMTNEGLYDVIEEHISDKLVYPTYSKDDIKIIKWKDGTHFYAKIGSMDVVDEDGNQKWDTRPEAYNAALNELKTL